MYLTLPVMLKKCRANLRPSTTYSIKRNLFPAQFSQIRPERAVLYSTPIRRGNAIQHVSTPISLIQANMVVNSPLLPEIVIFSYEHGDSTGKGDTYVRIYKIPPETQGLYRDRCVDLRVVCSSGFLKSKPAHRVRAFSFF
jgi:hypothetical protein